MHPFFEKVHRINSKLIPVAIVLLLMIIVAEIFLHVTDLRWLLALHIADGFVIAVFVVDLIFIAFRVKNTIYFFKNYWLDILAVIPLGLLFGLVSQLYRAVVLTEGVVIGQEIIHEGLEVRRGISAALRGERAARLFRVLIRSIRLVTKSRFFTKYQERHQKAHHNLRQGKNTRHQLKKQ